jgi:dethiobiotin synthetase
MTRLFVTGTGTDIGKTMITAHLVSKAVKAGKSVRVMKPVASGFDEINPAGSDPAILIEALGKPFDKTILDQVSPWRYRAPVAAHMAAKREGRDMPFGDMVDYSRDALRGPEDVVLIEGVGGVMAPLDNDHTVLDWLMALNIPTLLVAGTYVGTISHTLSALGVLRAAGIKVPAVVLSETEGAIVEPDEQVDAIRRFAEGVPMYVVPRVKGPAAWSRLEDGGLYEALFGRS